MSETQNPTPNQDPATPPSDEPTESTADEGALAPEDVRTQPPPPNKGSGQFAVWDAELGQYVSGVGDKDTAAAAKKELESVNGLATDGHTLTVREV